MKISDLNWMQVEDYLMRDDRAVVPLGSTEQHAYLSLSVDSILSERVACEAAEPLGIPVFPVLAYGITPNFLAYPGTLSLSYETYVRVITDLLDSLAVTGFKRIIFVNGHGGNLPAIAVAQDWMKAHPGHTVRFYSWWNAPLTWAKVTAVDPTSSHASWMENLPWTRLAGVEMPTIRKMPVDCRLAGARTPTEVRACIGDGNFGGYYQRPDADVLAMWDQAVVETRAALHGPW